MTFFSASFSLLFKSNRTRESVSSFSTLNFVYSGKCFVAREKCNHPRIENKPEEEKLRTVDHFNACFNKIISSCLRTYMHTNSSMLVQALRYILLRTG